MNFITRKGTDTPDGAGSVRYTFTDTTAHRVDAWYGREIAPNVGLFVGGFYLRRQWRWAFLSGLCSMS